MRSITPFDSRPCSSSTSESMPPAQSLQIDCQRAFGHRADAHLPVELGAADHRRHLARRDLQIEHRAVAHIGAPARQAVRVVAGSSPGCRTTPCPRTWWRSCGRRSTTGATGWPFLRSFATSRAALPAALRHRDIGSPSLRRSRTCAQSLIAAFRSSATSRSSSSSFISVR